MRNEHTAHTGIPAMCARICRCRHTCERYRVYNTKYYVTHPPSEYTSQQLQQVAGQQCGTLVSRRRTY